MLKAFADVENQLAATGVLVQQQGLRRKASDAANLVEAQFLNRYKAGQVSYTEVVQAQVAALSARRALVQLQADRQTTAVMLIQSLGGGCISESCARQVGWRHWRPWGVLSFLACASCLVLSCFVQSWNRPDLVLSNKQN